MRGAPASKAGADEEIEPLHLSLVDEEIERSMKLAGNATSC
jgi:hypothetical protein